MKGKIYHPAYGNWACMKARIKNFHADKVHDKELLDSFGEFISEIGEKPGDKFSIERIENNLGYIRGNIKWATAKEQANNRSNKRFVTAFGQTKHIKEWAEDAGLTWEALWHRLRTMTPEEAVTKPRRNYHKRRNS